jgi:alkylated DNA repair protein alkB homolog 6
MATNPSGFAELEKYRITSLPHGLYYIPNFIAPEEEQSLLDKALPTADELRQIPDKRWIELSHRRLQSHPSPLAKNQALIQAPLAQWLVRPCVDRMVQMGIWTETPHKAPNHCLINLYTSLERC